MFLNWQDIFTILGSTAIVVTVIAFVARGIFTQILSKDIERYKVRLKQDADLELAVAKHNFEVELQRQKDESQKQLKTYEQDTNRI